MHGLTPTSSIGTQKKNFHKTAEFDKRLFILFIQYLQNKE